MAQENHGEAGHQEVLGGEGQGGRAEVGTQISHVARHLQYVRVAHQRGIAAATHSVAKC